MDVVERFVERVIFASRWLLAPIYLGLAIALVPLVFGFLKELLHLITMTPTASESQIILTLLALIDFAMTAALIVIVIFSGYQNFVSRIDMEGHKDWPAWMGTIDFAGLKIKILSSIVAISAVELLKQFMSLSNVTAADERRLFWLVVIHVVFVFSSLVLSLADRLGDSSHGAAKH